MGSEGSHSTQNDTSLASGAKQQKKFALQAKVDELEAQNNKIAMKNEILQEQYEKVFEMFHEARYTKTHELINPAASIRSRRSVERHLLIEGVEGSKAVFRDCKDFLKQRRDNLIHVSSKINDPMVSERLGPFPCPMPATNLGKGQQVLEKHEGIRDSEMFRQTYLGSQYGESRDKSHALDQTFLLPRGDGDLRKKAPVVHDSTQDPLVLQLLKEVNKLKAERQAKIPYWNQPRPGPLTRKILDTPI
ncbi:hypothetical protein ACFX2H_003956 [Malus domestica]